MVISKIKVSLALPTYTPVLTTVFKVSGENHGVRGKVINALTYCLTIQYGGIDGICEL